MLSVAAIAVSTGLLLGICGSTTEPATTVPGSTESATNHDDDNDGAGHNDHDNPVASGRSAHR